MSNSRRLKCYKSCPYLLQGPKYKGSRKRVIVHNNSCSFSDGMGEPIPTKYCIHPEHQNQDLPRLRDSGLENPEL